MDNKRRVFLKKAGAITAGLGVLPFISLDAFSKEKEIQSCSPCTLDYYGEGPFYRQNPPLLSNDQLAKSSEAGERMIITGRVTNLDCTEFIADAVIDIWHADDSGAYDNSGYNLRGKVKSNSQGYYLFETIKPGKYLNGSKFRPSHIHFKITAPGKSVLTTQLYFDGDSSIPNDAAASIKSGTYDASDRIISLTKKNSKWEGTWDIVVAGDGETIDVGTSISHIDKGMIYSLFPNPFKKELTVKFGVFKPSNVTLAMYDITGKRVDYLKKGQLEAGKYELNWKPKGSLNTGHYFVALTINDLQVQYLKVLKV